MADDILWSADYKIPWNDPDFSRRMLALHLSQDHDLASRRLEWIDRQVDWIHRALLRQRVSEILDLGCGPGFYSHRLAALGHCCRGLDFSPAAVEYAQQHNPRPDRCRFALADLRDADFGGPCDLVLLLYGEMNVFSPAEILEILRKAQASLASRRGTLLLECQTPEEVQRLGRGSPTEESADAGLFVDGPYRCRTDCRWVPEQQTAVQTFTVTTPAGGPRIYRSTTKAWSPSDLRALLQNAGFRDVQPRPDWPSNTRSMALWEAEGSA